MRTQAFLLKMTPEERKMLSIVAQSIERNQSDALRFLLRAAYRNAKRTVIGVSNSQPRPEAPC